MSTLYKGGQTGKERWTSGPRMVEMAEISARLARVEELLDRDLTCPY